MNTKCRSLGLALAVLSGSVFAGTQSVAVQGNVAQFHNLGNIDPGGEYVFFTGLPVGTYTYTLTLSAQNIKFSTANLEGNPGTEVTTGTFTFVGVSGKGVPEPNFVLYLKGTSTASPPVYSGTLVVSPVGR